MPELLTDSQPPPPFSPGDILYAIFKHKWKILLGAFAGITAAVVAYNMATPVYESNAKLLVRYVVDRSTIDPEAGAITKMAESALVSECEILTSWDLAMEVVDAIGIDRLIPDGAKTDAAGMVLGGLRVFPSNSMIFVSYVNRNPELSTLILSELLNRYFSKHLEVHRSAGAFDFVTQQTDQVRARLNETEDQLRALKAKAGIVNLGDAYTSLSQTLTKLDEVIHLGEEEIAEQRTRVQMMERAAGQAPAEEGKTERQPPGTPEHQKYQAILGRLHALRQGELDLLARFTPENQYVKLHRAQIRKLELEQEEMEKKFPELVTNKEGAPPTLTGEQAKLLAMQAKLEQLKTRRANAQKRFQELSEFGSQIQDLERNQELLLNNYKYFKSTLEKARVDEALDPTKIPNITTVQRPTPPRRVYGKRDKMALALAGGGVGGVLVLVLLSELIINQTFKRPLDLEKRLGAPLLLSIPYNLKARKRRRLLPWRRKGSNGKNGQLAAWEEDHFIRPFAVAIRDRLNLYFELNRMTHKPKLVGVTGFAEGSGTSTLAAGLASALSEMGDGKVLLVDVNLGPHEVHHFFKGRPAVSLNTALQANGSSRTEPAAENLYLATVAQPDDGATQLGLKKFFDLMPNLKTSDFDYIIFDMPPLGQTSPTLGMAGFMDKVLLVVEAEKNNKAAVKRGFEALTSQRDNVSMIFNKARDYTPKWLNSDS